MSQLGWPCLQRRSQVTRQPSVATENVRSPAFTWRAQSASFSASGLGTVGAGAGLDAGEALRLAAARGLGVCGAAAAAGPGGRRSARSRTGAAVAVDDGRLHRLRRHLRFSRGWTLDAAAGDGPHARYAVAHRREPEQGRELAADRHPEPEGRHAAAPCFSSITVSHHCRASIARFSDPRASTQTQTRADPARK